MRILSIVHEPQARAELFGDVVRDEGHELEEWSIVSDPAPPRALAEYDAVFIFGGHMHVDQDDAHPWLRDEDELIRGLVERRVPLFGVCLGGQLLAQAAGARVAPLPEPERGFVPARLSPAAADDRIFGALPREFHVFAVHEYSFEVPEGGVELARSGVCAQAFRIGDAAWGIQFHPEVRLEQVERWVRDEQATDGNELLAELAERIDDWQRFGRALCRAFLAAASRSARVGPVPR
jgi:GMP synthase-like glutamine amidotransferase